MTYTAKSFPTRSIDEITLHLIQGRKKAVAQIRNKEAAQKKISGINRQTVILNMAERLSATAFRNLPAKKRNIASRRVLRLTAIDLLKKGLEVDEVIEALENLMAGM